MKLIELTDFPAYKLYEYGNCRLTISKSSPLHMCVISFASGKPQKPSTHEVDTLLNIFFKIDGVVMPYITSMMFTKSALHVWEKTEFTKEVVSR
jgi:hypothetical protein